MRAYVQRNGPVEDVSFLSLENNDNVDLYADAAEAAKAAPDPPKKDTIMEDPGPDIIAKSTDELAREAISDAGTSEDQDKAAIKDEQDAQDEAKDAPDDKSANGDTEATKDDAKAIDAAAKAGPLEAGAMEAKIAKKERKK